jgi:HPt (histidine-containing phosphotransfer) domain-containing protein
MFSRKRKAEFIDAKAQPPLMRQIDVAGFAALLRSDVAAKRAGRAMAARIHQLRDVVLDYVGALERAAQTGDNAAIYAQAHEIRGLAEMVGLVAAGRIANKLCLYIDTALRRGQVPDRTVVMLHVDAVSRSARAKDEATRLGEDVVRELEMLANYKLSGASDIAAE